MIEWLIRSGSLDAVHMIRDRRDAVLRVFYRVVGAGAFLAWLHVVVFNLGGLGQLSDAAIAFLSQEYSYGQVRISTGGILAFIVSLWLSWQLSRFIAFALEREVFTRVSSAPGVPFAAATFARYSILVIGVVIALAVLGFPVDRIVLVFSALGVGIGFGLQSIVNNFVSGLILLFERPIRVGDRIEVGQTGELLGVVTRIGIRASQVRTFDGSEVVVPNADLVSQTVVNWTLSDQKRRFIVSVGVAHGSDPERVLAILADVARAHPEVLTDPEPEVYFQRFGENALEFEVRAWTESPRGFLPVRSEVAVGVSRALREAGIRIPLPQREFRLRNPRELSAALSGADTTGETSPS